MLFEVVKDCTAPRLPLMRELSAKLTEGEKTLRFSLIFLQSGNFRVFSPSAPSGHLPHQREAWVHSVFEHYKFQFSVLSVTGLRSALDDNLGGSAIAHGGIPVQISIYRAGFIKGAVSNFYFETAPMVLYLIS